MTDDRLLWLANIDEGVNPFEVEAVLRKHFGDRVGLQQTTGELLVRDESARRLMRLGPTKLLGMAGILQEAVLGRGEAPSTLAAQVNAMLRSRRPAPSELVIVDPYFFYPSQGTPLPDLIDALWGGLIESASSVIVVAKRKLPDPAMPSAIAARAEARRKGIQFVHRASEAFHDRFWIVDRIEGVLVGTSVNGLGAKYAVADFLEQTDVREIVAALNMLGLLPNAGTPPTPHRPPDEQLVALAAYARWLARGCGDGRDAEDWSEAERFLSFD